MYQKRTAFTMIELIFVIVIIGILSAIAIPKFSATRDDALDARDCKNIATCITDLASEYTAKQTTTKLNSNACVRAESSTKNTIHFTVSSDHVIVSGAPLRCSYLNAMVTFGGSKISL